MSADATTNDNYAASYGIELFSDTSSYPHAVDGGFGGWSPSWSFDADDDSNSTNRRSLGSATYEWEDITPALGMFTNTYFDYNSTSSMFYILNDWIYNDAVEV